jgi:hypothetical protein
MRAISVPSTSQYSRQIKFCLVGKLFGVAAQASVLRRNTESWDVQVVPAES